VCNILSHFPTFSRSQEAGPIFVTITHLFFFSTIVANLTSVSRLSNVLFNIRNGVFVAYAVTLSGKGLALHVTHISTNATRTQRDAA
jgi:hypothetical protein